MKLKVTESALHRTVAELLDWVLLPPAVWTTFPAGWGKLGKATAGRLHGSGLKAGFPDILVFYNSFTIGIELKAPKGRLSKAQEHMFPLLLAAGVKTYICRDTIDVIEVLQQHSLPLRKARIAA